jgi:hypothetical protein
MLIVDQVVCLTVELEEDTEEETSEEAIGLVATYSNSVPTVFVSISIFGDLSMRTGTMWRHDSTTIHKQRNKGKSIIAKDIA